MNKVSTKVELLFDVVRSEVLTERRKSIILEKLANRISADGVLALKCDETRSQLTNKEIVFDRFIHLIKTALTPVKKRRPTKRQQKPTETTGVKRVSDKNQNGSCYSDKRAVSARNDEEHDE